VAGADAAIVDALSRRLDAHNLARRQLTSGAPSAVRRSI
jgi:hypothetical protein